MVLLFYTTYISVDPVHHEIYRAKVGKGGIKASISVNGTTKQLRGFYEYGQYPH